MPYCSESPSKASAASRVAETSSRRLSRTVSKKSAVPTRCDIARLAGPLDGPLEYFAARARLPPKSHSVKARNAAASHMTSWAQLETRSNSRSNMRLRLFQVALIQAGQAKHTTRGAGLRTLRVRPGFPQHGLGNLLRLTVFAAHEASQTLSVIDRESSPLALWQTLQCPRLDRMPPWSLRPQSPWPRGGPPVGSLEIEAAATLRRVGLDLVGLLQRREQRLRLGDLGHFRRRRKAFERGREDGVGFGGAAGRLVELGERQRREQREAARALPLRDGDGGLEGVFGWRGVGGIALEQDFAARAMQFRFERAVACALARRQRFVEDRRARVPDRRRAPRPRPARS